MSAPLAEAWGRSAEPDRLLPPGAEWALLRELRGAGGMAEARALLAAVRMLYEWRMPHSTAALAGSPEGERLLEALQLLEGILASSVAVRCAPGWVN